MLCELKMNIHNPHPLWISPVEKTVENVENYELSTGIPLFSGFPTTCGKACILPCIIPAVSGTGPCYVTAATRPQRHKVPRKSLQTVKFSCQNLSHFETSLKFFVKNRQRFSPVSFSHSRGILFTAFFHKYTQQEELCREK